MADAPLPLRDIRKGAPAADVTQPGFRLRSEPELGVLKIQIFQGEGEAALAGALGDLPPPRRQAPIGPDLVCAWLAPGEWLVTGLQASVVAIVEQVSAALGHALFLATDLSDARSGFILSGMAARDRIASGCPLDLRAESFPVGAVAQSMFGDTGLFLARLADGDGAPCFRLIVDQTMAGYVARLIAAP